MRIESGGHIRVYKKVHYQCDSCGVGNMMFGGTTYSMGITLYEHICSNCAVRQNFREKYPNEIYEERRP